MGTSRLAYFWSTISQGRRSVTSSSASVSRSFSLVSTPDIIPGRKRKMPAN